MSFLIGNGHEKAGLYPLVRVWSEVEIVQRRRNQEIKAQAVLDYARDGAIHGGKKGGNAWKQTMKDF